MNWLLFPLFTLFSLVYPLSPIHERAAVVNSDERASLFGFDPATLVEIYKFLAKYTSNPVGNLVDLPVPGVTLPDWLIWPKYQNEYFPDPAVDWFYQSNDTELNAHEPGDVLRLRKADVKLLTLARWEVLLDVRKIDQIYYRTTDTHGNAQGTVATIFKPKKVRSNPGILAHQIWMDASSYSCAPSWSLTRLSNSTAWVTTINTDSGIPISTALKAGHYVVVTDFQGPDGAFAVGRQAGHAILDGLRATIKRHALNANTPVVLSGYSGGGHATVWAADLATSYASDLNITGVIHGGTPINMETLIKHLADKPFSGLGIAGLVGMSNVFSELKQHLIASMNDAGKAMLAHVTQSGSCFTTLIKHYNMAEQGKSIWDYFPDKGADILDDEPVRKVLVNEVLPSDPNAKMASFSRLIFHDEDDTVIPIDAADKYVDDECARGAHIWWNTTQKLDHTGVFGSEAVVAMIRGFISQGLTGSLPKDFECRSGFPPTSGDTLPPEGGDDESGDQEADDEDDDINHGGALPKSDFLHQLVDL